MRHAGPVALSLSLLLAGCAASLPYSPALLQEWNEQKAAAGPTFAGSPAWRSHMEFLEAGFAAAGAVGVERYAAPYRRWWVDNAAAPKLEVGGAELPVASYWAYSGGTPPEGVTGELLVYDKSLPKTALRDRIVVFRVEPAPASLDKMFTVGREYTTPDWQPGAPSIADDQWYQGNFVTRIGRFDDILRGSGAAGAVVVFSMSAERLEGLYTFPLLNTGVVGVPGLYVDEVTGERLSAAAGEAATLTLIAREEAVEPYFYTAVLPGRDYGTPDDEQVLLVTHSDGPNLTQENGTLGILALFRHFSAVPQAQRRRSLRVLLDPQHYSPGRHTIDWYAAHTEIMARVVASLGVEHLGQLEYGENAAGYGLTGRPEPWQIFVRDDPQLISAAIAAIKKSGVPLTELRVPEKKNQGRWTGLGEVALKNDLPGYATLSDMSGYWSTSAGIESFDADLADRQLDLLVMLVDELMVVSPYP